MGCPQTFGSGGFYATLLEALTSANSPRAEHCICA